MPLLSIIGLLSNDQRLLPIHALASALQLQIEFADANTAIATTGTPTSVTYVIGKVFLDCNYVTLSDMAHNSICSITNNVFQFSSSVWRSYRNVHAAGQTTNSLVISTRVSSMKTLLTIMRESASEKNRLKSSVSQRLRANLASYQTRAGSQWIHAIPVECTGSALPAYMEALKCYGNPASESTPTLLDVSTWAIDADVAPVSDSSVDHPGFLCATDLEAFLWQPETGLGSRDPDQLPIVMDLELRIRLLLP